jgi:hypothetical protein
MSYKAAVKFISFLLLLSAHPAFSQVGAENKTDELLSAYAKASKLNGTVLVQVGAKPYLMKVMELPVRWRKCYGIRTV